MTVIAEVEFGHAGGFEVSVSSHRVLIPAFWTPGGTIPGFSSFVLTLTTYADYISEDELAAPKVGRGTAARPDTVVALERRAL